MRTSSTEMVNNYSYATPLVNHSWSLLIDIKGPNDSEF